MEEKRCGCGDSVSDDEVERVIREIERKTVIQPLTPKRPVVRPEPAPIPVRDWPKPVKKEEAVPA